MNYVQQRKRKSQCFTHKKKGKGSKYHGVHFCQDTKKYFVKICFPKGFYISRKFNFEIDASIHYNEFKQTYCKKKVDTITDEKISNDNIDEDISPTKCKKKSVKKKKRIRYTNTLTESDKKYIHGKARHFCELCKVQYTELIQGDVDHVIPLQYYGNNTFPNLQSLCKTCHKWKTGHLDRIIGRMQENKDNDIEIIKQIQKKLFNKKFGNKNNTNITINNGTTAINLTVSN
jgi:5-methylcytosine-specific restriction endonuclease McrA